MSETIYVDTETTGLMSSDEIVEIAVVGRGGEVLLNTLVKPKRHKRWPDAQDIHGITPPMVKDAPSYDDLRPQLLDIFRGKKVVIYNKTYDSQYIGAELSVAKKVVCAMRLFAKHTNAGWWKLGDAAHEIGYQWTGDAHRALADTLACRAVWLSFNDE
ncbi:3'-5' exonuclease [Parendozoicomonas sp. Alg238-R29]|uniref:3'-5' exonuclease n=1 Tax=Parendozoicomonas sp. Alg238-R29 TaxID=2993446 RepID=UPI00248DE6C6|nr:3'-5' exonuclease [Parendozoicomonas sp. Alg238-R29]